RGRRFPAPLPDECRGEGWGEGRRRFAAAFLCVETPAPHRALSPSRSRWGEGKDEAAAKNRSPSSASPSAGPPPRGDRIEVEPHARSLDKLLCVAVRNSEMLAQRGHTVRCCGQFYDLLGRGDPAFVQLVDQILCPAGDAGQKRFSGAVHALPSRRRTRRVCSNGWSSFVAGSAAGNGRIARRAVG